MHITYVFFKCCPLPRHMKLPLTMIASRVHSASHSAMLCDVRITERPSFTTPITLFHTSRRVLGSMPVVGSSWKPLRNTWKGIGQGSYTTPAINVSPGVKTSLNETHQNYFIKHTHKHTHTPTPSYIHSRPRFLGCINGQIGKNGRFDRFCKLKTGTRGGEQVVGSSGVPRVSSARGPMLGLAPPQGKKSTSKKKKKKRKKRRKKKKKE